MILMKWILTFPKSITFIDVINKKVDPITNASDAKRTLKVALSILESAKLNSIIKI